MGTHAKQQHQQQHTAGGKGEGSMQAAQNSVAGRQAGRQAIPVLTCVVLSAADVLEEGVLGAHAGVVQPAAWEKKHVEV